MSSIIEVETSETIVTTTDDNMTIVNHLVSTKGEKGDPGEKGDKGDKGDPGDPFVPAYGAFHDTSTHTNPAPAAVRAFTYNNTDLSNGITVDGSQIIVDRDGVYNFQFSVVVNKADGGTDSVDMWFAKNGQDIPDSNTRATLNGNGQVQVLAWNFLTSLDAGDHIELKWYSADTALSFPTVGPFTNPTRPRVPSIIATITQIAPLGV